MRLITAPIAEGPRASIALLKFWVKVPELRMLSHAITKLNKVDRGLFIPIN